jgi:hypothetical protein
MKLPVPSLSAAVSRPDTPRTSSLAAVTGGLVDAFDGRYYRIGQVDALPPFFMSLVSASDLWLFVGSNGGLTAGRVDAEDALFPYEAVDRLYDSAGFTGPLTAAWLDTPAGQVLWEPLAPHARPSPEVERHLYKSVEGDRIWFEETHRGHGLCFRYGWATAADHGFVRQCELTNLGAATTTVRLLDGLRNLQPPGIPRRVQETSSCLADAYKTAEVLPGSALAVFALSAGIVDRAIPLEVLRAGLVWSEGLPEAGILLSDGQLPAWFAGSPTTPETRRRGVRCSYLLDARLELPPGVTRRWLMVADTGLTQTAIVARRVALAHGSASAAVLADVEATTRRLRHLVGRADGLQDGGAEITAAHHFANVLFNVMRGGTFADEHRIPREDFARHIARHSCGAGTRHAAFLEALPPSLARAELLAHVARRNDPTLARLAAEYLPVTFSRRHGDPSRPWNRFRIHVRDEQGCRVLAYEGNWRDIFQNWEALCLSYPEFFDAVVAKFLNASTADGYNPYRISHRGIDWEVPEHDDPWATIGYWGDHQVIYLQKLLEWSARFHPGALAAGLREPRYAYANVPYRIAPYAALRRDPRSTIEFDAGRHRAIIARERTEGADARLLGTPDGGVLHVSLVEKLLVLILTRLTNFVPGGGIWMNTQRPEWNDANNALVGYGVSMVTLCYLRRMLAHTRAHLGSTLGTDSVPVSAAVATLLRDVHAALSSHRVLLERPDITETMARQGLEALAAAGTTHRETVYASGPGPSVAVPPAEITAMLDLALRFADHTIRANRRDDGLYHAYNLLEFAEQPAGLRIHRLAPMLEGQVAVLSAGVLAPAEAVALLAALRSGPLYRADQHSYVLYPDRDLPGVLERNVIPDDAIAGCPLLVELLAAGDGRLVIRDAAGQLRFHADLVNDLALEKRLGELATDGRWTERVSAHARDVRAVYERVFHHHAFTGRSGTMFGYEGLGCIYWHMVAKLLLAVQENALAAAESGAPEAGRLAEAYHEVRAGLGFNKTVAEFGAFPTDPYSHTPGHAGAQQPGMTGQVKEEILTRWGELGICVSEGRITFAPTLLRSVEFRRDDGRWAYVRHDGSEAAVDIPAGALGFTVCGTPVVYRRTEGPRLLRLHDSAGAVRPIAGSALSASDSTALIERNGQLTLIEVDLGADYRPLP